MKHFLPDGYRWANMIEKRMHERRPITGALRVPVENKSKTLIKRLAVPA